MASRLQRMCMSTHPDPVDTTYKPWVDALVASELTSRYDNEGEPFLEISRKGQVLYFGKFVPKHRLSKRFSRYIRVRLIFFRKFRGRVLRFSVRVNNYVLSRGLVVIPAWKSYTKRVERKLTRRARARPFRRPGTLPRNRSARQNEYHTGIVPYLAYNGTTFSNNGNESYPQYTREFSSVRTPNFSKLRSLGKLPVNSYHLWLMVNRDYGRIEEKEYPISGLQFYTMRLHSYYSGFGSSDFGPSPSIAHSTVQRNRAIERLKDRVIGQTQNLSETVATMNRTFDLIGGNARKIATSIGYLKKFQFSKAADSLFGASQKRFRPRGKPSASKSLASNWLELQYGWKPLLNDVHYAVEALGKLQLKDVSIGSTSASATEEVRESHFLHPNSIGKPPTTGFWNKTSRTTSRFVVRYRVSDPFRAFMSQSGFTNPVSLAWELIPYSFVVDWFLPIGPYLESLDAWGGLQFLDGSETTFTRASWDFLEHYSGFTHPDGDVHTEPLVTRRGRFTSDQVLFDRGKLNGFPSPNVPKFKNPFTIGHALNGIALLVTAFRR